MDIVSLAQPQTDHDSRRAPGSSSRILWWFHGTAAAASRRIQSVLSVVGVVLVGAGLVKTHQLLTSAPFAPSEPLWLTLLLIEVEVCCGLGLLTRRFSRFFRGAALWLFTCFLGAALAKAFAGARSCGCLGSVPLDPWLAVGFDVFALTALMSSRPERATGKPHQWRFGPMATFAVLAAAPVLTWAVYPAQGAELVVQPQTNLGVVRQGQRQLFDLSLRNSSKRTIVVDQLDSSCKCLAPRSVPIAIPSGNEIRIAMELDLSKEPEFTGRLVIQLEGRDSMGQKVFQSQVMVEVD